MDLFLVVVEFDTAHNCPIVGNWPDPNRRTSDPNANDMQMRCKNDTIAHRDYFHAFYFHHFEFNYRNWQ